MTHDFSALARAIDSYLPMPAQELERLTSVSRVEEFEKGAVLLREGEPASWLGFLERGLLRIVHRVDDREVNLGFELEGAFIGAYDAYVERGKSPYELEALEGGSMVRFERASLDALILAGGVWRELARLAAEREVARKARQQIELRTRTPEERYVELVRSGSPLVHRVPQYHLASFLGVTPETLSRIRARMGPQPRRADGSRS